MRAVSFLAAVALPLTMPGGAIGDTAAALGMPCWNCHGPGGASPGEVPPLDGMSAAEIAASLRAFRAGEQEGTIMNRIAKGYTDAEIDALSAWLAEAAEPAR